MVRGPAAAFVASAHRLGWQVLSYAEVRTDWGQRCVRLDQGLPVCWCCVERAVVRRQPMRRERTQSRVALTPACTL